MRWTMLAVLLPLAPVAAQEEAAATQTPAQRYEELQKAYQEAAEKWMADYQVAVANKDQEARTKLLQNRAEAEFLPRFVEAAEEHAGSDDAVPFLVWVATRGYSDQDKMKAAIATLVDDHVTSSELGPVASRIRSFAFGIGRDKARDMLTCIVEKNEHVEVQANALMARAEMYAGTMAGDATDEERAGALADLRKVVELTEDERLAERARNAIHEEETLGVGKTAPDIEGEDLDGVAFKLSDYRGKVVLLDFWGDW